jgi:NADH-quinone oxidoreductase subunit A
MQPQSTISFVPNQPNSDQMTDLHSFEPLLVLIIVGVILAAVIVLLSWILGPKRSTLEKLSPYECGVDPVGNARERFPVKFYLIAMLFIVFDIETVFLYPWAIAFRSAAAGIIHSVKTATGTFTLTGSYMLGEMLVFMIILFVGYIYVWKKGAFNWE